MKCWFSEDYIVDAIYFSFFHFSLFTFFYTFASFFVQKMPISLIQKYNVAGPRYTSYPTVLIGIVVLFH